MVEYKEDNYVGAAAAAAEVVGAVGALCGNIVKRKQRKKRERGSGEVAGDEDSGCSFSY